MEPKIRFKGFEGGWKEERLSEISSSIASGKNIDHKGPYPLYGSTGIIGTTDKPYHEGPMLLVARVGANAGFLQLVNEKCGVSDNTLIVKPKDPVTDNYLFQYFKFFNLNRFIYGSGQPLITGGMLKKMPVRYGLKEERETLIDYFTSLDSQISASTSRLASLKQMKAASLQAMFPQEGETVPKIRFKGFEGEWKKVKLGDIAKFSKGQGYSKSDLKETGHPIILYGRMYTKYQFAIDEVDTFANLKDASILSEGNEIIMPASGETPEDIACASAVLAKDIILGGDLNIMHFDLTKFSTPYIALVITYSKTHHDLSKCAQGKSVVHLHNGAISRATISLPSLAEQQAIASYFTSLDRQISLQSQRLKKLKQIKSACLDKMFV